MGKAGKKKTQRRQGSGESRAEFEERRMESRIAGVWERAAARKAAEDDETDQAARAWCGGARPPAAWRMTGKADREQLRRTFDTVAERYQDARPEYPDGLFDALISLAGLRPERDAICEAGPGPGKATLPLARRGFLITAVELGAALADEARRNLAGFDRVTVVHAGFESWRPPAPESFGLVFAATAWHWVDPDVRYLKAWELLKPGGHLAFWEAAHVFPGGGDPFFREIQDVYDEINEGMSPPAGFARPDELADATAEIEASGLFTDVTVRRFDWEIRYTAESYIRLLDTFSGHIAMADWQRDRLYGEIRRRLAARPGGQLRRHWGAVLHVARKIPGTSAPGGRGGPD